MNGTRKTQIMRMTADYYLAPADGDDNGKENNEERITKRKRKKTAVIRNICVISVPLHTHKEHTLFFNF